MFFANNVKAAGIPKEYAWTSKVTNLPVGFNDFDSNVGDLDFIADCNKVFYIINSSKLFQVLLPRAIA